MKKVGKVLNYDGRFGTIISSGDKVSFSKEDLTSESVEKGDIVEYRLEEREPDLKIARFIKVLKSDS